MRFWRWAFVLLFFLCGCSTTQDSTKDSGDFDEFSLYEPDPLELFNRYMYGFNRILDIAVIQPVAITYELGTPENFKYCVKSFVKNAYGPINLLNYTLQGRIEKAATTTIRFILNTTLGLFGLLDFADFVGIKENPTSFNETLASWGVEAGPYIMLPVLGPTTFRGAVGYAFDWFADPLRFVAYHSKSHLNNHHQFKYWLWGITAFDIINTRADLLQTLDDIYTTSKDSYVTIRSMIFQKQKKLEDRIKKG